MWNLLNSSFKEQLAQSRIRHDRPVPRRRLRSESIHDFLGYPQNLLHTSAEFNLMFTRCFHIGRRHNPVAAPQIDYIALRTSRDRTAVNVRNFKHSLINGQPFIKYLSPTDRCSDLGAM